MAQVHVQNSNGASPKQLKFQLVHYSGEVRVLIGKMRCRDLTGYRYCFWLLQDPEFPASELNTHSPQTKGWQTPPFCDYPQELGLVFCDGPVQVSFLV